MANEKKKQEAPFYKKANGDFRENKGTGFQNGGSAAYQPRDANTGKTGQSAGRKKQIEKSMQAQQETFTGNTGNTFHKAAEWISSKNGFLMSVALLLLRRMFYAMAFFISNSSVCITIYYQNGERSMTNYCQETEHVD